MDGLTVVDVAADGNCAFHAISDQLKRVGVSVKSSEWRKNAINILSQNMHMIDEQFLVRKLYRNAEVYLEQMSREGTWTDEIMLRAVSEYLQRNVIIHYCNGHKTTILPPSQSDFGPNKVLGSTMNIGLVAETHYTSLASVHEPVSEASLASAVKEHSDNFADFTSDKLHGDSTEAESSCSVSDPDPWLSGKERDAAVGQ